MPAYPLEDAEEVQWSGGAERVADPLLPELGGMGVSTKRREAPFQ